MWEGRFHTHVIHQVQLWFCITAVINTNLPDGFPLPVRLVSVMCESPSFRIPFTAPVTVSLVCVLITPLVQRRKTGWQITRQDVEGSSQDPTKGTTLPRHQPRRTQNSHEIPVTIIGDPTRDERQADLPVALPVLLHATACRNVCAYQLHTWRLYGQSLLVLGAPISSSSSVLGTNHLRIQTVSEEIPVRVKRSERIKLANHIHQQLILFSPTNFNDTTWGGGETNENNGEMKDGVERLNMCRGTKQMWYMRF